MADALGLDGSERLLDVGCGPGSLTPALAPRVRAAVGIDANAEMIAVAARSGAPDVEWRHLRAEELPAGLGEFDLVTFAQRGARSVGARRAEFEAELRLLLDAPVYSERRRDITLETWRTSAG